MYVLTVQSSGKSKLRTTNEMKIVYSKASTLRSDIECNEHLTPYGTSSPLERVMVMDESDYLATLYLTFS